MPPSLSAIERGDPPPRQKSCTSCIKAKRRCDLRTPSCQRCAQRGLACVYSQGRQKRKTLPLGTSAGPGSDGTVFCNDDGHIVWNSAVTSQSIETSVDLHQLDMESISPEFASACADPVLGFLDHQLGSPWRQDIGNVLLISQPPQTQQSLLKNNWKPEVDKLSKVIASRLKYAIEAIRNAPRTMILENHTPWCHPELYTEEMPRAIQGRSYLLSSLAYNEMLIPLIRCICLLCLVSGEDGDQLSCYPADYRSSSSRYRGISSSPNCTRSTSQDSRLASLSNNSGSRW